MVDRAFFRGTLLLILALGVGTASADAVWLKPEARGVAIAASPDGTWKVTSSRAAEFTVDSEQSHPARAGQAFEVTLRIRVGLETRGLPELVCFDAAGREIPVPSSLARWTIHVTTNWQTIWRVFPTQPGTASVRARIRGAGKGELSVGGLVFRPTQVDPYATGMLITQPHPKVRTTGAVLLESNFGIMNLDAVSPDDRDGDGKWALVTIDLDRVTEPEQAKEDWRTGFEDNPNVILWSDGAVLKSDSVTEDRLPERARALHFRYQARRGPYVVKISDPGRAVAVSTDGKSWRRYEGGSEIVLGEWDTEDGVVEFWLDACYRDPVSAGPVYFDYVSLMPVPATAAVDRLFAEALKKPNRLERGNVTERSVPVQVDIPVRGGTGKWPVGFGLPVLRGELVNLDNVMLATSRGEPVPVQARVKARWPDESIKWLYLDFQHDLAREPDYVVRYGNKVGQGGPQHGVVITETPAGIEVDTGAMQFNVSRARFGLIEDVRLRDRGDVQRGPIAAEITEENGRVWRGLDAKVTRLELEQRGPMHAGILVETAMPRSGGPAEGFYHQARIHAFAGSPVVQVDYFVANTDSRVVPSAQEGSMAGKIAVRSFSLRVTTAGRIGNAAGLELIANEGQARTSSGHGYVELPLAAGAVLRTGVAAFREQFPKALRWRDAEVSIDLWAEEGGVFDWIEGVGKTHTLIFDYGTTADPVRAQWTAHGPVRAFAAPEWYAESGAFGAIDVAEKSGLPAIEATLARHIRDVMVGEMGLGFENYGDHSSTGYVKGASLWDNNEYDAPGGCLVHFARTGDRAALEAGLAGARHAADVDTIHYSSEHADWARAHHVHSHAVFGHHTAQGPDFHHAGGAQGLILYSYLTGDPTGLETARGIANWCVRNVAKVTVGTMERAMGHPLMTLNDVYEATGEERYLRAAARLVDLALKWEHPARSGFFHSVTESPAYYSGAPFTGGLLTSGLLKFNSWANVSEIDALLERIAQWTLTDVWLPGGLQQKGGRPRNPPSPLNVTNHSRSLVHVYERTRDPFFLIVPRELAVRALSPNTRVIQSRSTGLVFNYLPTLIDALGGEGNPERDAELEVTPRWMSGAIGDAGVMLKRGGSATVVVAVRNVGKEALTDARMSFRMRRDFRLVPKSEIPSSLAPGETAELVYEVHAPSPQQVNLTTVYHREAYAHWTMLHRRGGRAQFGHRWVKVGLE